MRTFKTIELGRSGNLNLTSIHPFMRKTFEGIDDGKLRAVFSAVKNENEEGIFFILVFDPDREPAKTLRDSIYPQKSYKGAKAYSDRLDKYFRDTNLSFRVQIDNSDIAAEGGWRISLRSAFEKHQLFSYDDIAKRLNENEFQFIEFRIFETLFPIFFIGKISDESYFVQNEYQLRAEDIDRIFKDNRLSNPIETRKFNEGRIEFIVPKGKKTFALRIKPEAAEKNKFEFFKYQPIFSIENSHPVLRFRNCGNYSSKIGDNFRNNDNIFVFNFSESHIKEMKKSYEINSFETLKNFILDTEWVRLRENQADDNIVFSCEPLPKTFSLDNMPATAGVYVYKDVNGHVIYVGRTNGSAAKRLREEKDRAKWPISSVDFFELDKECCQATVELALYDKYKRPKYNIDKPAAPTTKVEQFCEKCRYLDLYDLCKDPQLKLKQA